MYVILDDKRRMSGWYSGISGKNKKDAIKVDCKSPSDYHVLKSDYQIYSGAEQWELAEFAENSTALLAQAEMIIDAATAAKIAAGIEIDGVRVTLSSQTQFNLGTDHRIRESLVYPYRYRTDSGVYIDIHSAAEFDQFFMAGRNFIRQCLDEGDAEKDAAAAMTTQQLSDYINNNGGQ